MSDKPGFAAKGTEEDRLKFLRHEGGNDVYLDLVSGKEVFVGRPTVRGDSETALFTRLQNICHEVLNMEAEMQPLASLGDKAGMLPLIGRLKREMLPQVDRIIAGAEKGMAFAYFARGLILRILLERTDAEATFRKANELQPAVINILRELVRCLGEQDSHEEALAFAREAVEAEPADAGAWGNLAICLIQTGQRQEARKAIDHAIKLAPLNRCLRDNFDSYFK